MQFPQLILTVYGHPKGKFTVFFGRGMDAANASNSVLFTAVFSFQFFGMEIRWISIDPAKFFHVLFKIAPETVSKMTMTWPWHGLAPLK